MAIPVSTSGVRVKFMGDLTSLIGQRTADIPLPPESTVSDLFNALSLRYGEPFTCRVFSSPGKLQHTLVVFVNGRDIKDLEGFATPLGEGEVEVVMLPMFEGG